MRVTAGGAKRREGQLQAFRLMTFVGWSKRAEEDSLDRWCDRGHTIPTSTARN